MEAVEARQDVYNSAESFAKLIENFEVKGITKHNRDFIVQYTNFMAPRAGYFLECKLAIISALIS